MFPQPALVRRQRCARCRQPTRVDRLVAGRYGRDCAEQLGLIGSAPDIGQAGPDLLDLLQDEPEDCCDGFDRPKERL